MSDEPLDIPDFLRNQENLIIERQTKFVKWLKENHMYNPVDTALTMRRMQEVWDKYNPEPKTPVCCVCGTKDNLRKDGWYGYRCDSDDCMCF